MSDLDYPQTTDQNNFNSTDQYQYNNFSNINSTMPDTQTPATGQAEDSQMVSQGQPSTNPSQNSGTQSKIQINDILKSKKALHSRIKKAYLKRIAEDIEKGRKSNVDINKFIFDLVEIGLKQYEK